MIYENIVDAIFISRPNRFIAYCLVDGKMEICHVKNTGRCKELLFEGVKVILQRASNPDRKTKFDLIAVYKDGILINIDSQVTNKVFGESVKKIFHNVVYVKPEYTYGNSRIDFYLEEINEENEIDKVLVEIKGVTLEQNGVVKFPDAPTTRGVKHIHELMGALDNGYRAYVVFIIQLENATYLTPNYETHKEFGDAMKEAMKKGVKFLAFASKMTKSEITLGKQVEIKL